MSLQPYAQAQPSPLPQELLELVFNRSLHWTSPTWTRLFVATLNAVLHHPLNPHTPPPSAALQVSATVLDPFPIREDTLCRYVAYLGQDNLKHRTIKAFLSALWFAQIQQGMGDPFQQTPMPLLEYVLLGIKRSQARFPIPPKPRLPITPQILAKLQQWWVLTPPTHDGLMLWAAVCVGFFGFR